MRTVSRKGLFRIVALFWAVLVVRTGGAQSALAITNLLQLRQFESWKDEPTNVVQLDIDGQVCWVNRTGRKVALLDASGGAVLEIVGQGQLPLRAGQVVRLTGQSALSPQRGAIVLDNELLVVDNDGAHVMTGKSTSIFLSAGRRPVRLEWFNQKGEFGLTIEWEGPDWRRHKITDAELYRIQANTTNWASGLDYREYEGWWDKLPRFSQIHPIGSGICSNFDLTMRSRKDAVGLQFCGFLEVPRDGLYTFYLSSDDGSRLFVSARELSMEVLGSRELPMPREIFVGQIMKRGEDDFWAVVEGKVSRAEPVRDGLRLELRVGLARMEVQVPEPGASPEALLNNIVRVTGYCQCAFDTDGFRAPNLLLVPGLAQIEILKPRPGSTVTDIAGPTNRTPTRLPVLTSAADVHRLKPEEARLGYPVQLRGVVTGRNDFDNALTLQDSTRGVYVRHADSVEIGEYVEVEALTAEGGFAPVLDNISRLDRLGWARLPEPILPAWDQLMNGSLDNQFAEVEGIVAATSTNTVDLLTPGGLLRLGLANRPSSELAELQEDALVRIRGTLGSDWNKDTHQFRPGFVWMGNFTVIVEKPPPRDLFDAPSKTPAELLLFDSEASVLQRVRISGQVVHLGEEASFLMAGSNGVRFVAASASTLRVGDMVDVAGYPDLGSPSAVLRKAAVRTTGHKPLPAPTQLSPSQLLGPEYDSTLVSVTGVLAEARETSKGAVLDMLSGARSFVARLNHDQPGFLHSLLPGSRLELTGVYSGIGGNRAARQGINSFELLLDSNADIRILARPSWWTLQRLLVLSGALAGVLAGAALWITQLHRTVEQRTRELAAQIREREQIEQHRAMEQERARIARDLHDELGSGLTEIRMLATLPAEDLPQSPQQIQIASRSRQMVRALDEIVWAMNPKHDSLRSLGSYFCLYAERFLKPANITCRLKGTLDLPDEPLNPLHRHEFFLGFKEALTNIVRHSGATQTRLGIHRIGNRLRLSLADNGEGLKTATATPDMDGLANMRSRIERIGGRFSLTSLPGRGTTLRFYVPLK